jgi:hypothetical protein
VQHSFGWCWTGAAGWGRAVGVAWQESVLRCVAVEYADGHMSQEAIRFVVVHSSSPAQWEVHASTASAKEAERGIASGRVKMNVFMDVSYSFVNPRAHQIVIAVPSNVVREKPWKSS